MSKVCINIPLLPPDEETHKAQRGKRTETATLTETETETLTETETETET